MKRALCIKSVVEDFINEEVERGETILVAVSGGVDSVVLLHVLAEASMKTGNRIHVVHVNHGLRGDESDADAAFVEDISALLGLPFTCASVFIDGKRTGIEAAARGARYDALEHVAKSIGAGYIAVGHNADDVAETFLMNLSRGSGPSGLSSHRSTRKFGNTTVIRPLHGVTRGEIEEFAIESGIKWREDSSNQDPKFLRNRVRHELLPLLRDVFGPNISLAIHRSSGLIEQQCIAMDAAMEEIVESVVDSDSSNEISLRTDAMSSLGMEMLNDLVRRATRSLGEHPVTYDDTKRIVRLLHADAGKTETLSRGIVARRKRGRIVINGKRKEQSNETV